MNHRYIVFEITVVFGKDRSVPVLYAAFHASVCAPQLSFIRIKSLCQSTGDPVGAQNVAQTAKAVSIYISVVSAFGVGVADDAVVETLDINGDPEYQEYQEYHDLHEYQEYHDVQLAQADPFAPLIPDHPEYPDVPVAPLIPE